MPGPNLLGSVPSNCPSPLLSSSPLSLSSSLLPLFLSISAQHSSVSFCREHGEERSQTECRMASPPPCPGPDPLQFHQRTQVAELPSMDTTCHPLLCPQRPLSQGSLAQRLSLTGTQCGRCLLCHSSAPPPSIATMDAVAWPQSDHQIFCFVLESFPCPW